MITVINSWSYEWGATNTGYGGQSGQVTHCKWNGHIFYTRETTNAISSFQISSAERMGDKVGLSKIRPARQALELLADAAHWDEIAAEVKKSDPLKRPVFRNNQFNKKWIQSQKQ